MIVRNRRLQRLIAVLLVTLVAVSAQAWASHVDWPVPGEGDHAHVEFSAFDDDASPMVMPVALNEPLRYASQSGTLDRGLG